MKDSGEVLLVLAMQFSIIALLSLGGFNAALPEIHRQAVELSGWVSERQFADMFALSMAIPGPNIMLIMLIGHHVAGVLGALVATMAICGPTAIVATVLSRTWDRFKDAPWRIAVQDGLVPISVGLVGATALMLTQHMASHSLAAATIAAVTAAVTFWSRLNPLWLIAAAGLAGIGGLV
jgi:chromate transporter